MERRKRPLTLLEVGIAVFLTAILLSFLWNLYHRCSKTLLELQKEKQKILRKIFIQEKFSLLFSHLCMTSGEKPKKIFYAEGPEGKEGHFYFSHDAGIDRDPNYCGPVVSALYVNDNKQLCLASWSSEGIARIERLADKVEECKFSFFDVEKKEWTASWEEKKKTTPALLCIFVEYASKEAEVYSFDLFSEDPIFYKENG